MDADAAVWAVQFCDSAQVLGTQPEVEDADILADSARVGGLGNDDQPVVQVPTDDHLGRRLVVPGRDLEDGRVP